MASFGDTDELSAPTGTPLSPTPVGRGYSRFVRLMKLALPLVAVAMIVALLTWPQFDDNAPQLQSAVTEFIGQGTGGHRLTNARFTGTDRNRNPYGLTAEAVVQQTPGGDEISLSRPEADFTTRNGAWVAVSSPRGRFARKRRTIVLEGGVSLFHDSGYALRTDAATVDLAQATVVSDTPVTGQGPAAHLEAAGFRIPRDGKRIAFTGPARVVLYGDPEAIPK